MSKGLQTLKAKGNRVLIARYLVYDEIAERAELTLNVADEAVASADFADKTQIVAEFFCVLLCGVSVFCANTMCWILRISA